jgi:hypothetical protein
MLDISRYVVAAMSAATFPADAFSRILDASQLRPGGSLECVDGDLTSPMVCPGLYDVVIERKTLQLFPATERAAALATVAARLTPNGILFTHAHDGRWRPGRSPRMAPAGSITRLRTGGTRWPSWAWPVIHSRRAGRAHQLGAAGDWSDAFVRCSASSRQGSR